MTAFAKLEKAECESLVDFIECEFLPYVQNPETEVDNMIWVSNICSVWKKCKKVVDEDERTDKDEDAEVL